MNEIHVLIRNKYTSNIICSLSSQRDEVFQRYLDGVGEDERNELLSFHRLDGADLSGLNLREADLRSASLIGANLSSSLLDHADLTNAFLVESDLRNASLVGADMTDASLHYARFEGADLSSAVLTGAKFSKTTAWPRDFDPNRSGAVFYDM